MTAIKHLNTEEKMLYMFTAVHGECGVNSRLEIVVDEQDQYTPVGVSVVKNGMEYAYYSKMDILFDYETRYL